MKREPDAILESPAATKAPFSAILDCKASRDGWGMDADDEHDSRTTSTPAGRARTSDEPFLIILSSAFNTGTTAYEARRDAIRDRCGARLVYWQASHLTAAALAIEKSRLDPAERGNCRGSAIRPGQA